MCHKSQSVPCYYGLHICIPYTNLNPYVETLSSNKMVLEGRVFGRWLGQDSGGFMLGLVPTCFLFLLSAHGGCKKSAVCNPNKRGLCPELDNMGTLLLNIQPPWLWEINHFSHRVCGHLLEQPKWSKKHTWKYLA